MKENAFARELRAKHSLKLGGYGDAAAAHNGEPYVVLAGVGGEDEAAEAFDTYRKAVPGFEVWWRVVPEITSAKGIHGGLIFYMRLIIV